MTVGLTRQRVDLDIEKKLLTGLIVSDRVCKEVFPILRLEYLQSEYIAIVTLWAKAFWDLYEKAPGKHIQDIYKDESKRLRNETQAQLIADFLTKLSQDYEEQSNFNEGYLVDQCIDYIDERSLVVLSDKIKNLVNLKKKDEAKGLIADFRKVAKVTSSWVNPFDPFEVNNAMDMEQDVLFKMPGALGDMVGPFERGFFVGWLAPVKRGKTWMLIELAMLAMIHKLKVAFISLEMRKERMEKRIYKRIASVSGHEGDVYYPVFDCVNNQDGSCKYPQRTGNGVLIDGNGEVKFNPKFFWKTCTWCRENDPENYFASEYPWFEKVTRPKFDLENTRKTITSLWSTFNLKGFRLKCYPRFSANLADIMRDLSVLEYSDGFVPDVVIIDYADILRAEKERDSSREMINETWMTLAQLADVKRCLVATVSQSNKKSWSAATTKGEDVSEDYRKMAHVDIMFTMSQTPPEKARGVLRMGVAAHRDEEFNEFKQVTILQQLGAGQSLIDSDFIFTRTDGE